MQKESVKQYQQPEKGSSSRPANFRPGKRLNPSGLAAGGQLHEAIAYGGGGGSGGSGRGSDEPFAYRGNRYAPKQRTYAYPPPPPPEQSSGKRVVLRNIFS